MGCGANDGRGGVKAGCSPGDRVVALDEAGSAGSRGSATGSVSSARGSVSKTGLSWTAGRSAAAPGARESEVTTACSRVVNTSTALQVTRHYTLQNQNAALHCSQSLVLQRIE